MFKDVKGLYIMVPALIGLKGNLDMCLASRLSTQANLGNIDSRHEFFKMIIGNVFLVQVCYFFFPLNILQFTNCDDHQLADTSNCSILYCLYICCDSFINNRRQVSV